MAVLRKGAIVGSAIIHHGERRAQTKRLCHFGHTSSMLG
jgi:hypothetical protein